MNIRNLFDSLSTRFEIIKGKLLLENSVNDVSLNILLESTYVKILNEVYGYKLVNANLIQRNFPAVDAIDEENGIYVQITSTFSKEKIQRTILQIYKNKLSEKYHYLIFFFLKGKKTLQPNIINKLNNLTDNKLGFNAENCVYDNTDLYQKLYYDQDYEKTTRVLSIINRVLELIPEDKESGYESVSVSFLNELENAYLVVDSLIKEGVNVYINSSLVGT